MKTRYVADTQTVICLEGLRFVKKYKLMSDHWWLAWGHKGMEQSTSYPTERERDAMFNRLVEGMNENGGLIYATNQTATSR